MGVCGSCMALYYNTALSCPFRIKITKMLAIEEVYKNTELYSTLLYWRNAPGSPSLNTGAGSLSLSIPGTNTHTEGKDTV